MTSIRSPYVGQKSISIFTIQNSSNMNDYLFSGRSQQSCNKLESPKIFQRKPSYKVLQKKSVQKNYQSPKIFYISPQKSDIFKRYSSQIQFSSQLSISDLTDNQVTGIGLSDKFLNKSSYEDLKSSRSIFADVQNQYLNQKSFQTPKRNKIQIQQQYNLNRFRKQRLNTVLYQENDQANISLLQKSQKNIHNYEVNQQQNHKKLSQNFIQSSIGKKMLAKRKIQTYNFQKLNNEYATIETKCFKQKINKLEQSNKSFQQKNKKLEDMNSVLQKNKQSLLYQISTMKQKINELQNLYSQLQSQKQINLKQIQNKNSLIDLLTNQINQIKQSDFNKSIYQHELQLKRHYQYLNIKLNQQIKYLKIQNDILKKQLAKNNEKQQIILRMQKLQKKLNARNKFLEESLQQIQKQNEQNKKKLRQKQRNSSSKQNIQYLIKQLNRLNVQLKQSKAKNNLTFQNKNKQQKDNNMKVSLVTPKSSKSLHRNKQPVPNQLYDQLSDGSTSLVSLYSIETLDFDLTPDTKNGGRKDFHYFENQQI